jgi:hypothetical protein
VIPRLPRAVWTGLLSVCVVAAVAFAWYHAWHEQGPPAPETGVVRLVYPEPYLPPPRRGIPLSSGSTLYLAMLGIDGDSGSAVGRLIVLVPGGGEVRLGLHQGETASVDGVTIAVVRLWQMPNSSNDAIDLHVTAPA